MKLSVVTIGALIITNVCSTLKQLKHDFPKMKINNKNFLMF